MDDQENTENLELENTEIETESEFIPTPEDLEFGDDEIQTITTFDTPQGSIAVVHDITMGDLLIATLLAAILIFQILNQLIRRF